MAVPMVPTGLARLLAGGLLSSLCLASTVPPTWGQVAVNPAALAPLQPAPSTPQNAAPPTVTRGAAAARRPQGHPPQRTTRSASVAAKASATPHPKTVAPSVAATPPPTPSLSPPTQPSPRPAAESPHLPAVTQTRGTASELSNGVRISFEPNSADLNPASMQAIKDVAHDMGATGASSVSLYSYSSGPIDDPSAPRRLALSRALAVRAVLISEGIASTRIYPRVQPPTATGGRAANDPPDRIDLVIANGAQAASSKTP